MELESATQNTSGHDPGPGTVDDGARGTNADRPPTAGQKRPISPQYKDWSFSLRDDPLGSPEGSTPRPMFPSMPQAAKKPRYTLEEGIRYKVKEAMKTINDIIANDETHDLNSTLSVALISRTISALQSLLPTPQKAPSESIDEKLSKTHNLIEKLVLRMDRFESKTPGPIPHSNPAPSKPPPAKFIKSANPTPIAPKRVNAPPTPVKPKLTTDEKDRRFVFDLFGNETHRPDSPNVVKKINDLLASRETTTQVSALHWSMTGNPILITAENQSATALNPFADDLLKLIYPNRTPDSYRAHADLPRFSRFKDCESCRLDFVRFACIQTEDLKSINH